MVLPASKRHPERLLSDNPLFLKVGASPNSCRTSRKDGTLPYNLTAFDGCSRLYFWNREDCQLHAIDVQKVDGDTDGGRLSYLAGPHCGAQEYQTLELSIAVKFEVRYMTVNRPGRLLALVGDSSVVVVDVIPKSYGSAAADSICSATSIGIPTEASGNSLPQKVAHVMWHPFSDIHLGVLYSQGVFELFNLASDKESPEQKYYLWLEERTGFLKRPISFAFGSDHLWLRFAIFFLSTDGCVYILCPVVPFGSRVLRAEVDELAKHIDNQMETRGAAARANLTMAQLWLENTFPDSNGQEATGTPPRVAVVIKAYGFCPADNCISLQGPLQLKETLGEHQDQERSSGHSAGSLIQCRPTSLLHSLVGADCLLSVAGEDGKVHIFFLAREVAPRWQHSRQDLPSAIETNSLGNVTSIAMAVGPSQFQRRSSGYGIHGTDLHEDEDVDASINGPPLLLQAEIDLVLEPPMLSAVPLALVPDPVVPERMYCCHGAGVDAIEVQWPPPTEEIEGEGDAKNLPEVHPILDFTLEKEKIGTGLMGMTLVTHGTGEVWVVAVRDSGVCTMFLMQPKGCAFIPRITWDGGLLDTEGAGLLEGASADILRGPKSIPDLEVAPDKSLGMGTVEGRKYLHSHCKLLHEKYVEYAHRVYVELQAHGKRLAEVAAEQDRQSAHLHGTLQSNVSAVAGLATRLQRAVRTNNKLEERVRKFSQRPAVSRRPLTAAERDCKAELAAIAMRDVDLMQMAIEELSQRAQEIAPHRPNSVVIAGSPSSPSPSKVGANGCARVPDSQMRKMKSAVEQLSVLIQNMADKVKILNNAVAQEEGTINR